MKPLPECHFTTEDWDVIIDVVLRCGRIVDGSMFGYWVMERSRQSDRRDAAMMLDNVKHHVSAVVQAPTGDWCYFVHGSVATGAWVRHL
jgi:hypothetical protein